MPLGSDTARNAVLDTSINTAAPTPLYLALYAGDPMTGGTEITGGGYARVSIASSGWAAASAGVKATNAAVSFPFSTAAWSATATHAALLSASTGGTMWDVGVLASPITVTSAGTTVTFPSGSITIAEA